MDKLEVGKWELVVLGSYTFWVLWMTYFFVKSIANSSVIWQAIDFFWLLCLVAIQTAFTIETFIIRPKERKLRKKIYEQEDRIFELEYGSG